MATKCNKMKIILTNVEMHWPRITKKQIANDKIDSDNASCKFVIQSDNTDAKQALRAGIEFAEKEAKECFGRFDHFNQNLHMQESGDLFINAKSNFKVPVVDGNKRKLNDSEIEKIGNGSICNVVLFVVPYEYEGEHGATYYLQAIQVVLMKERPFVDFTDDFSVVGSGFTPTNATMNKANVAEDDIPF